MTRVPPALALLLALGLVGASAPSHGAGRRPYAGRAVAPVASFDGLTDPHAAIGRSARFLATLAHCQLLRPDGRGGTRGELARDVSWQGRALAVTLVDGARFQDGRTPVRASDVAASLARFAQLGDRSPWAGLVEALSVREVDPLRLVITPPRGTTEATLRALLARPELAVLRGGRPGDGAGCGPFRVTASDAASRRLEAFEGHPLGRPWLDTIVLKRVAAGEPEQSAFVFGDVDFAFGDGPRSRRLGRSVDAHSVTYFALPHPRFRGPEAVGLRQAVAAFARAERLGRYVEGRASAPSSPWPPSLAPSPRELSRPRSFPQLPALTIAYRADDHELGDLARALRDSLRQLATGTARVVPVDGLDAAQARSARSPEWDLALVRHEWGASTAAEAAAELAFTLGLTAPAPDQVLGGKARGWADRVVADAAAIPVLHVERPLLVRPGLAVEPAGQGLPDLAESWRPR